MAELYTEEKDVLIEMCGCQCARRRRNVFPCRSGGAVSYQLLFILSYFEQNIATRNNTDK
jgi:hypothetical protein